MGFKKNIIKGLLVGACLLMPASLAYAGTTELLNVDFEGITFDEFKSLDVVTIRPGISTDNLTIGEESKGNQAFRIYRTEAEVKENTTSLGFNYKLPQTLTSGKVNVSFKIKAENVFRSRWRDLGSAMTSGGKRNLFLFTYSQWAWAQSTGSAYWNSTISTPDVWYEVKYEIDLDTKNVVIGAGKVGTTIQTKEKTSSGGDFDSLEFTIGKQHNSWTEYGSTGDIVYWIDDIKVMVSGVNVLSTSVDGKEDNAPVDEALKVTLYTPSTDSYIESLEPATTVTTLGGVLMEMASGGTQNDSDCYQVGTQVDEDTVNNPDNFGIAWIYGVTVEKVTLDVKNTSFDTNFNSFSPDNNFTVTFNQKLDVNTVNTSNIELYENDNKISAYEYTINLSADEKSITINPVAGIKYGTTYKINISKNVKAKDSQVADMFKDKAYIINTAEYQDTEAPDITWSTLPDGVKNVDYATENVILSTNGVLLASETITKENIKMFENGAEFTDYTVEPSGLYAVKVNFGTLKKDATYKITVSGLLSGGSEGLGMTEDYETTFTTRGDIYTDAVSTGITADGEKSYISAELYNKSGAEINYQVVGVLKDADGKIINVALGSKGSLVNDDVTDIRVENAKDADAKYYDLYIWDGIGTMKPLVKKATLNSVNERTYGYDNYMDSSKDLKISYIGGSITQQRQYSNPLSTSLNEIFKKDNDKRVVSYSVQGLGGTNSTLGLYRLEKDVIDYKPDLVFIEFAVNDTDTLSENRVKSMEGIIRKLMNLEHQPMVILLDVTTAGYQSMNVIADWKPLMDAYGIGYVNVAQFIKDNEATEENPDGLYVWREADLATYPNATALTATDGVHPTAAGGKVYADYIYKTISENPDAFFRKMTVKETPVTGFEYNNPRMIAWDAAEYDTNWTYAKDMNWTFYDGVAKATSAGATLTYKFTGTTIGLFLPKSKTGTTATYSIDNGAYTGKVSCYGAVSTDMPMMSMISTNLEEGEHTITLTVDNAENVNFRFGHFIVD